MSDTTEDTATRINVPEPTAQEERRQLAETIAEIHSAMRTIIIEDNGELLPGESKDELKAAWSKSDKELRGVVQKLSSEQPSQPAGAVTKARPTETALTYKDLQSHGLTGAEGKAKRNWVKRKLDEFWAYWNSQPRTDEKRKQSAESAIGLLKISGTLLGSIPVVGEVLHEIASLVEQAVAGRMKRGY
jgi:hypothetical protein